MPVSIDRPPNDNEIECGNCGAYIPLGLSRCPECGVNLFEPDDTPGGGHLAADVVERGGIFESLRHFWHRLFNKPYAAQEVFGSSFDQGKLYANLLAKVAGDEAVLERLVAYEQRLRPGSTRAQWLKSAIQRWEKDNRARTPDDPGA